MIKKKIALVIDSDSWAFANTANMIKKHLSNYYDFSVFTLEYLNVNLVKFFLIFKDYDLIHFIWREPLINFTGKHFEEYTWLLGSDKNTFMNEYVDFNKITTGVYDHLYIDKEFYKTEYIFSHVKNYSVSSKKLLDIYNKLDIKYKPTCIINDGIDLNRFYPDNLERFNNLDRPIVIGFSGNSNFANGEGDLKGVNTIIKPAVEELQKEGFNVVSNFADSYVKKIPFERMNDYYNSIDILICASTTEGTPYPVLEAMACGVPIISTDVGVVREAFGPLQSKYILKERSITELKKTIKKMITTKNAFADLSKENIEKIKIWDWSYKVKDYKKLFDKCLKENNNVKKD